MTIRVLLALGLVMAWSLGDAAWARDAAGCKSFLTGAWTGTTERLINGRMAKVTSWSLYKADGRFASIFSIEATEIAGAKPIEQTMDGTWDTRAGAGDAECEAVLTPLDGGQPVSMILTVVDNDTVRTAQGNISMRVKP